MCKKIFLVLAFLLPFKLLAQNADAEKYMVPDYASIKQMTEDPNSAFFYPNIFKRYKANDTTLSFREYRMLYYGYVNQPDYKRTPLHTPEDDSIAAIFDKGMLSKDDLKNIVRFGIAYLEKVPFDLKRLNLVHVAASESGDDTTAKIYLNKVRMLALTVLTTGNGLSKETPFYVISDSDENAMINILGYKPNEKYDLDNTRYVNLEENDDDLKGLYFDMKNVTVYRNMSTEK